MHLAFLLDGHWSQPEIVTPLSVLVPPVAAVIGCYLVARRRQWVGYALGVALASAVFVFARVMWVDVTLDLGAYPVDERLIILFGTAFPFLAIGLFYWWPPGGGRKPLAEDSAGSDRP